MSLHSSLNGLGYGDMAESMKAYLQKFWVLKLMGKPFPLLEKHCKQVSTSTKIFHFL